MDGNSRPFPRPNANRASNTTMTGYAVRRHIHDTSSAVVQWTRGWQRPEGWGDEPTTALTAAPADVHDTALAAVEDAVRTYGPAPGARRLLEAERVAAEHAISRQLYVVWRCSRNAPRQRSAPVGQDCTRIGSQSLCFCGHRYGSHEENLARNSFRCLHDGCICDRFNYIPNTAEECGEWWLPRRRDFDPSTYRAKCKCGHNHLDHSPKGSSHPCRMCKCGAFNSAFLCVACDTHSEDHETIWEDEDERRNVGREVGDRFMPLAAAPRIASLVFTQGQRQRNQNRLQDTTAPAIEYKDEDLRSTPEQYNLRGVVRQHTVSASREPHRSPYVRYIPPRHSASATTTSTDTSLRGAMNAGESAGRMTSLATRQIPGITREAGATITGTTVHRTTTSTAIAQRARGTASRGAIPASNRLTTNVRR